MNRKAFDRVRLVVFFCLAIVVAVVLMPTLSFADETADSSENIASGNDYGFEWVIDSEGCLSISGEGQMPSSFEGGHDNAWFTYSSYINAAVVDASTAKSLAGLFAYCRQLKSITFVNSTPSAVSSTSGMFYDCSSLTELDLTGLDTSNVTDMSYMFFCCSSLTELDLTGFDTSKTTDMNTMFSGCSSLAELDLTGLDASNVTDMREMFAGCKSLSEIDLSSTKTACLKNINRMFHYCSALTKVDIAGLETSGISSMDGMFQGCSSLTGLDISHLDTTNLQTTKAMFYGCTALTQVDLGCFKGRLLRSTERMFYGCSSLKEVITSGFNTSRMTNFQSMFYGCSALSEIDVSDWNMSSATNLALMFYGCESLKTLDASNWNTGNVTSFQSVFSNCYSLESIDVGNWDTSSATNMRSMFDSCKSLKSIDVGNWDTSNVTHMGSMFEWCESLTTLDLSNFDFSSTDTAYAYSADIFGYGNSFKFIGTNNFFIKAPKNLSREVPLPKDQMETFKWVDSSGVEVSYLPLNQTESIIIAKEVKVDIGSIQYTFEPCYYNGQDQIPVVHLVKDGKELTEGIDYAIDKCWNNINAGQGSIQISGIGKYRDYAVWTYPIYKAEPNYVVPDGLQALRGQTLEEVELPEGFSWENPLTVMDTTGVNTYRAIYTPSDTTNYNTVDNIDVTVTVFEKQSSGNSGSTTAATQTMYRLYNPNSGEHFYTADASERDYLKRVGWKYEGVGWTAPKSSSTPVYRLYSGTDHHYTTDASEKNYLVKVGWKYEGIGWYSDDAKGQALYRQFNPNVNPKAKRNNSGSHNYTTSKAENDSLVKVGWRAEGIGWYGVKA